MNIFELASKRKSRFPSAKGELTVEQLWDLPLQSKTGLDLDSVAKAVNTQLKSVSEESFVNTKENPNKGPLELKLEVLKHIISVRIAENEAARVKAANAERRKVLLTALEDKQNAAIQGMSTEALLAELEKLGS